MIIADVTSDGHGSGNQVPRMIFNKIDPDQKIKWTMELWVAAASHELEKYDATIIQNFEIHT